MTPAEQKIALDAGLRLARQIARVYSKRYRVHYSDLESSAYEGVAIAWARYDPLKGSFKNYARWWIMSLISDQGKVSRSVVSVPGKKHNRPDASLNAPPPAVGSDDPYEDQWQDSLTYSTDDTEASILDADALEFRLATMSDRQRYVVKQLLRGRSQEAIGVELGVSRARVGQIVQEALAA